MPEVTVPSGDHLILSRLRLSTPAQQNRSEWTGRKQVIGLPGAELWLGQIMIDILTTEEEERPWRAFLFGLRGPYNWFRCPLPCNQHAGAKPQVNAASSPGYTLPLKGLTPSVTILQAGQYMTVPLPSGRQRAVMLTAPLVSNASGLATAAFVPALGEVPANNATVETKDPFIPFSPVDPVQGFDMSEGIATTSFEVEEMK